MLAQQYKAMYPTLETDVEGELLKLKVTRRFEEEEGEQRSSRLRHFNVLRSISELRGEDQAHGEGWRALHVRGPSRFAQEDPGRRSQRSLTGHRLRYVCVLSARGIFGRCDRIENFVIKRS